MGFKDTLNNIGEGLGLSNISDGFGAFLNPGGSTDHKYPTGGGNITNTPAFNDGAWRKSLGYSFKVVRVKEGKELPDKEWKEFLLQINPQELTQDEVFAIEVTPTFRGVLVEHHGITLKDITMSGTTGVSPNRREGGAFSKTGAPIFSAGHSGYQEFHELRSYFRVYVERKRTEDRSNGELRMVFTNYKDAESLYVEPQKFTMKRSSSKPFMYDYSINLKAIGATEVGKHSSDDLLEEIIDTINDVSEALNDATNVISGGIALLERTERDVSRIILGPLRAINEALHAIQRGESTGFDDITRRSMERFGNEVTRIESNFNDALGRDMGAYDRATGRVSTVSGPAGRQSTFEELKILNAFGSVKRSLKKLLTQDELFVGDANVARDRVVEEYGGKIEIPAANSVKTYRIKGNDDIQTIAASQLGSPDRFRDLVIVNNLKPPYIGPIASSGVLRPGDEILIPQSSPSNLIGVRRLKEYEITKFLSESEKNLGVDLRLTDNGDLAVTNTSDLDLIAGLTNMSQALALRIELEKGSLKRHPEIGTGSRIGEKVTSRTLVNLRNDFISSVGSDARVEAIPFIEASQDGGTTTISMVVKLRNLDQPIPIPIKLTG